MSFGIRPAGKGAPKIDPKPILDGWKLLEATAVYRASGRNALYGDDSNSLSIGQVLLLPKPLLEKRVLSDNRIEIYKGGPDDIKTGQIDRRVLATLAYLAESGLKPTGLLAEGQPRAADRLGQRLPTLVGQRGRHREINGIPILGNQDAGGITEQTVRRVMRLQGTMAPDQVISLLELGGPTVAMGDHADHIHVGFRPLFGDNKKLGRQAMAVLKPGQWSDLLKQLRSIDNPVVPTKPSKYALPGQAGLRRTSRRVAQRRPSASFSWSSATCSGRPMGATSCAPPGAGTVERIWRCARSERPSGVSCAAAGAGDGAAGRCRARAHLAGHDDPPEPFADAAAAEAWLAGCARPKTNSRPSWRARWRCSTARCTPIAPPAPTSPPGTSPVSSALVVAGGLRLRRAGGRGALRPGLGAAAAGREASSAPMEAPDERFAALLGGREAALACEELMLRARADADAGREREAALQARIALECLLSEVADAARHPPPALEGDRGPVGQAANAALKGPIGGAASRSGGGGGGPHGGALRAYRLRRR